MYVRDTVEGFVAIAQSEKTIGEEINIATQTEISMLSLAQEIIAQINPGARIVQDEIRTRPQRSEVERLLGSNRKIRSITGWEPNYKLSQGLAETIRWFSEERRHERYKSDIYNI